MDTGVLLLVLPLHVLSVVLLHNVIVITTVVLSAQAHTASSVMSIIISKHCEYDPTTKLLDCLREIKWKC